MGLPLRAVEKRPVNRQEIIVKPTPSMNTQMTCLVSASGSAEAERRLPAEPLPSPSQSEGKKNEKGHVMFETLRTTCSEKSVAVIIRNKDESVRVQEFPTKKVINGQRVTQV